MYLSSNLLSAKKPMTVLLVMSMLAFLKGEAATCDESSASVKGRCYEKERLLNYPSYPGKLAVDFHTNVLYFSGKTRFYENSLLNYLDLTTKATGVITQVGRLNSLAVDQDRHEVYIAGRDGIYKFHYNNKTAERILARTPSVYSMIYKDELYYARGIIGHAFTLKDGRVAEIEDMKQNDVEFLAIDKDGYMFFRNTSGLFGKSKGSKNVDIIRATSFDGNMATDVTGTPYACEPGHFYIVNKEEKNLEAIGELYGCSHLAFDKENNLIYSTSDEIIRLNFNGSS